MGLTETCNVMLGSVPGGDSKFFSIILVQLCILKESSIIFYLLFLYVSNWSEFFHVSTTLNINVPMQTKSYIAVILEKIAQGSKIVFFSFLLTLLIFYFISERRVCNLKIAEKKRDVRLFSSFAIHIPGKNVYIYTHIYIFNVYMNIYILY